MRILVAVACFVLVASAQAQTPASNPVMDNYHAYRAALDRHDIAGAEAPAAAALAASEARDGDGGHTGVFALNLAVVRLWLERPADALAPAQRADQILTAHGAASGIDPVMAQLVLGQAQLPSNPSDAATRITAALSAAANRPDLEEEAYDAGMALGNHAFDAHDFAMAQTAFAVAVTHANAAPDPNYSRARAEIGDAASALAMRPWPLTDMDAPPPGLTPAPPWAAQAVSRLNAAMALIRARAAQEDPANGATPLQALYGKALAWRTLAQTIAGVQGDFTPQLEDGVCAIEWIRHPSAEDFAAVYPESAIDRNQQGVVIVRAMLDADAHITRADAIATAPAGPFAQAGLSIQARMTAHRAAYALAGCRMPHIQFVTITFRISK